MNESPLSSFIFDEETGSFHTGSINSLNIDSDSTLTIEDLKRLSFSFPIQAKTQRAISEALITQEHFIFLVDDTFIENCSICFDSIFVHVTKSKRLKCDHIFHTNCIEKAWKAEMPNQGNRCPNCRNTQIPVTIPAPDPDLQRVLDQSVIEI